MFCDWTAYNPSDIDDVLVFLSRNILFNSLVAQTNPRITMMWQSIMLAWHGFSILAAIKSLCVNYSHSIHCQEPKYLIYWFSYCKMLKVVGNKKAFKSSWNVLQWVDDLKQKEHVYLYIDLYSLRNSNMLLSLENQGNQSSPLAICLSDWWALKPLHCQISHVLSKMLLFFTQSSR